MVITHVHGNAHYTNFSLELLKHLDYFILASSTFFPYIRLATLSTAMSLASLNADMGNTGVSKKNFFFF